MSDGSFCAKVMSGFRFFRFRWLGGTGGGGALTREKWPVVVLIGPILVCVEGMCVGLVWIGGSSSCVELLSSSES